MIRLLATGLGLRLVVWSAIVVVAPQVAEQRKELARALWALAGVSVELPAYFGPLFVGELGARIAFHLLLLSALIWRWRWVANTLLTAWAMSAILSVAGGIDRILYAPLWVMLISPASQHYLARRETQGSRSLTWPERARVGALAVLSSLIPGAGQLVNQRWKRAAIIFLVWTFGWVTYLKPLWTLTVWFAAIDAAWITAERIRSRSPSRSFPENDATMSTRRSPT